MERVALVYKFYIPVYGGIERLMDLIAKGLLRRGIKVRIITLDTKENELSSQEIRDNIDILKIKPIIVVANQIDLGVSYSVLKKAIKEIDLIHVFSSIPSSLLLESLKVCKKKKKICIWQPIFIPERFRYHRKKIIRTLGRIWDRYWVPYLTKYVNGIVALTRAEAEFFRKRSYSRNLVIDVLGECVEEVIVDRRLLAETLAKYGLLTESYILSVGRLVWYKGYDLLIRAWRFVEPKYPDLKLVIVGNDWGYKRVVLDMIQKYGLRNVVLLEGVPNRELHALYEGSLFVVQLSRFETFHRIALEAWSHRKPIVALDLGPATEHIASDRGILVHDDVREVVRALETLIEDGGLRRRMGLRGYEVFRSRYRVDRYVDKLLDLYRRAEEVARS